MKSDHFCFCCWLTFAKPNLCNNGSVGCEQRCARGVARGVARGAANEHSNSPREVYNVESIAVLGSTNFVAVPDLACQFRFVIDCEVVKLLRLSRRFACKRQ